MISTPRPHPFGILHAACNDVTNSIVPFLPFQKFFVGATTTIITNFYMFYLRSLAVARFD